MEAPHDVEEEHDTDVLKFKGPYKGWFFVNQETGEVRGFEESLEYVVKHVNLNGPYDGVLGFSQGAMLGKILMKLNEI